MENPKSKQLSELIEKYHQGLLSKDEQILLDLWLEELGKGEITEILTDADKAQLKNNLREFIGARKVETDLSSATVLSPTQKTRIISKNPFKWVYRVAAAITLLAVFSYILLQFSPLTKLISPDGMITTSSVSGSINKVLLADGSIVWLKNNSTLSYPSKFSGDERHVTLQGEALFEVAKDPKHPFIVQCGELTTTVLGTSFNIKANEKDIEVVVLTGRVALKSSTDAQGIVLVREEKAIYKMELKQLAKVEPVKEEAVASISGTEYDMNFNDTQMREVIGRIERKFNVKVTVQDPSLGNCVITADFTDQSLKKTLDIITTALDMQYEVDGDNVVLNGKGCK